MVLYFVFCRLGETPSCSFLNSENAPQKRHQLGVPMSMAHIVVVSTFLAHVKPTIFLFTLIGTCNGSKIRPRLWLIHSDSTSPAIGGVRESRKAILEVTVTRGPYLNGVGTNMLYYMM